MKPRETLDQWGNPVRFPSRIAEIAVRQGGATSTAQLRSIGTDSRLLGRLVRDGWLIQEHRAAYRMAGHPLTDRTRLFLALFAYGPEAVLCGRSAAYAHGFTKDLGPHVHLLLPTDRRDRRDARTHQTRRLRPEDVTMVGNLRTTAVARTVLDSAMLELSEVLAHIVRRAGEKARLDLPAIARLLRHTPRHPGVGALRAALMERDPNQGETRSGLELRTSDFLVVYGFPPAERNVKLDLDGEVLTLADFVWGWAQCCLEMDHRSTHDGDERFDEDRLISRRLQAAGWTTPRATGRDLRGVARRDAFARDLWSILTAAVSRWWSP